MMVGVELVTTPFVNFWAALLGHDAEAWSVVGFIVGCILWWYTLGLMKNWFYPHDGTGTGGVA